MNRWVKFISRLSCLAVSGVIFTTGPAWATQGHGAPEGLFVHQFAHIFFLISMGILIYWLRERNLVREVSWRCIQYSAMFFILWNLDTFIVHFLEEQSGLLQIVSAGSWQMEIRAADHDSGLPYLYYLVKLDHLLCVPALFFLYAGLKRLLKQHTRPKSDGGAS